MLFYFIFYTFFAWGLPCWGEWAYLCCLLRLSFLNLERAPCAKKILGIHVLVGVLVEEVSVPFDPCTAAETART